MVRNTNRLSNREEAIARRVRDAREASGLTLKDVGAELGLSEVGYGHYERGIRPFRVQQVFVLSRLLRHSVQHFLGLDTGLTDAEDRLLAMFRAQDDRGRDAILNLAQTIPLPPIREPAEERDAHTR